MRAYRHHGWHPWLFVIAVGLAATALLEGAGGAGILFVVWATWLLTR